MPCQQAFCQQPAISARKGSRRYGIWSISHPPSRSNALRRRGSLPHRHLCGSFGGGLLSLGGSFSQAFCSRRRRRSSSNRWFRRREPFVFPSIDAMLPRIREWALGTAGDKLAFYTPEQKEENEPVPAPACSCRRKPALRGATQLRV